MEPDYLEVRHPGSSSHSLIGGVVGAGLAAFGAGAISWGYFWGRVVLMIFLTPLISFCWAS